MVERTAEQKQQDVADFVEAFHSLGEEKGDLILDVLMDVVNRAERIMQKRSIEARKALIEITFTEDEKERLAVAFVDYIDSHTLQHDTEG